MSEEELRQRQTTEPTSDRTPPTTDDGNEARETLDVELEGLTRAERSLLEDQTRREIVRHLREAPGLNKNQLRRRIGVRRNTIEFHLDRLEGAGIVVTKTRSGGNEILCFLASDVQLWEDEKTRILFGRSSNRQVALYVAENPGTPTEEVAEAVDLKPVTVLHHLSTLRSHNLVDRVRTGNQVSYYPTPVLEDWAGELGEGYETPWRTADA